MTFAELPDSTWFVFARKPDDLPLFKSDGIAVNLQHRQVTVSADEEVLVATLHSA